MAARDDRKGLSNLREMRNYEVSDGEPDPRGWDAFTGDGVRIGRVEELLVDTDAMRVRALELRIDEDALHLPQGDRALFIPIRAVTLEETAERAVIPDMRSEQVGSLRGRTDFESFSGGPGAIGRGETATGREREVSVRETGRPGREGGGMQGTGRGGGMQAGARSQSGIQTGSRGDIGTQTGTRGDTGTQAGTRRDSGTQAGTRGDTGMQSGARGDTGAQTRRPGEGGGMQGGARGEGQSRGDVRSRDESERGPRR